ncbi:winged helix-turn-helix domain-containing protein [Lysobacter solisilvae (ex Woo and Kim 2022)]|uniref:Winged helix-turn-helix domain-containing protein n=1 Tax=Agrilutibacter terrestris TaxID=2865112 RepID=A0A7H0FWJ1_9GAMM|nr:winged helix-turn-helix domain-containing protein [Lysobacter terrestris]QNP40407.1 winged helix-turn-helix domain-containing protein [Lysobacter terrestris]
MQPAPLYRFGDFVLDPAVRELWHCGAPISLPPKSFDCLVYLLEHRDRAVGRDELIAAVWGKVDVSDAVLAQTLLRARRAVGDTGSEQTTIRTVPRFGYHWVAAVHAMARTTLEEAGADTGTNAAAPSPEPATDVAPAVAGESPATASSARESRWRWAALVSAAAVALALLSWWGWQGRNGTVDPTTRTAAGSRLAVVLPVTIADENAEQAWVRLGAMDYIASRLRGNGDVNVLPSSQVLQLAGARGDSGDAQARRLLDTTGARWVMQPQAIAGGKDWTVRLHLLEAGKPAVDVEARGDTALAAAATATDTLLRRLGRLRSDAAPAPTALAERLQQIDAELLAGQLANARALIQGAAPELRKEPQLQLREGQLEFRAGRFAESTRVFDGLLAEGRAVPDEIRAQAAAGLGATAIRSGDFRVAEQRYSEALALLEPARASDPALLGNAYNGRGIARVELGHEADGIADIGRARLAMQRAGNELETASVDTNLGMIESHRGNDTRALQQFDRAIATFERFGVQDNLVAVLQAKANSQMRMAQPAAALATIERAAARIDEIENPVLAERIGLVHARVSIANGRLREADAWIARLQGKARVETQPALDALRLRLRLVRGDARGAAGLAQAMAKAGDADGERILLGVQAALRVDDRDAARAWLARADAQVRDGMPWLLAKALLAARETPAASESAFTAAEAALSKDGTLDARVIVGCAHAVALVEQGATDRAGALLGEIATLADNDYRVAHTTLALYRALGDHSAAGNSEAAVRRLAGERDPLRPLVY